MAKNIFLARKEAATQPKVEPVQAQPTDANAYFLVDIGMLEEPTHLLRTVDEESPEFLDLVASMKAEGFIKSKPIEVTGKGPYIINDGMHRRTAAKKAGLTQVWISIVDKPLTDTERLQRALSSNATVVQTKPVDYAKALVKLQETHPGWTLVMLAENVRKRVEWVQQRLKVASLDGIAADLVNTGKVNLASGAALARLQRAGIDLTDKILARAQSEPAAEFVPDAEALLKSQKGPVLKLRPLGDVRAELERAKKDTSMSQGYLDALSWVLRLDPASLGEAEKKGI